MWRVCLNSVAGFVLTQAYKDALGLVVAHALSISAAEQASEPSCSFFPCSACHQVHMYSLNALLVLSSSVHASCMSCVLQGTHVTAHDMEIAR